MNNLNNRINPPTQHRQGTGSRPDQKKLILELLQKGLFLSQYELTVNYGIGQPGARISELRANGNVIHDIWCKNKATGSTFKKYWIGRKF